MVGVLCKEIALSIVVNELKKRLLESKSSLVKVEDVNNINPSMILTAGKEDDIQDTFIPLNISEGNKMKILEPVDLISSILESKASLSKIPDHLFSKKGVEKLTEGLEFFSKLSSVVDSELGIGNNIDLDAASEDLKKLINAIPEEIKEKILESIDFQYDTNLQAAFENSSSKVIKDSPYENNTSFKVNKAEKHVLNSEI